MTNLSIVSQDEVSENQVTGSRVAKTQQPGAERLKNKKPSRSASLVKKTKKLNQNFIL